MNYLQTQEERIMPTVVSLNTLLADYHIYYQNLRNFHWNILGENFFDLHAKFEELYGDARVKIDEIAERILTLRFHPVSRFSDYIKISNIEEVKSLLEDREMVTVLIENHAHLLKQMKDVVEKAEKAGDEGTVDLMGGYIRSLEKQTWMLNAWNRSGKDKLKRTELETVEAS